MKQMIAVFLALFFLLSCSKEVEIDIPGFEERVVVDGSISTGQPPVVLLSKSKDIYSETTKDAFLAGFVSGAIVTVSDGINSVQLEEICSDNLPVGTEALAASLFGVSIEDLEKFHLCAYTSFNPLIWGVVGRTYALKIEVDGKTYTSSTKIEQPTQLDKVYWVPEVEYPNYGKSWATLSDASGQYDAYMWEVKRINTGSDGQSVDAIFKKVFAPVFDDLFFDGLTFSFNFENPMSYDDKTIEDKYKGFYKIEDTLVIRFSKMDAQVYEFQEKKYAQLFTAGNPFATPTNVPTNIIGGALGVWAGYSPSFDTLICKL
jgi:hypothetical protein